MKATLLSIIILVSTLALSLTAKAEDKTQTINVKFETSAGNFTMELYPETAPKTVENFLSYVDDGFYNGTVFHRVIQNFMIQGGGFSEDFSKKKTKEAIENESDNGLKNDKWSIAMARTQSINSATAQFFINTKNNSFLNYSNGKHGYAVFGKVIDGYEVIDSIENEPTGNYQRFQDVPLKAIVINKALRLTN